MNFCRSRGQESEMIPYGLKARGSGGGDVLGENNFLAFSSF